MVMNSILMRKEPEGKQAVLGSSGAPLTLACSTSKGKPSRDYQYAKAVMDSQPELWHALMETRSTVISGYLVAKARAGVNVLQRFESWGGSIRPSTYRTCVLPYTIRIFEAVKQTGAPAIQFGTGTGALPHVMIQAGGDVMSVDWRLDLDTAWKQMGYGF
jgi:uroporphyrinogen decarboxylase